MKEKIVIGLIVVLLFSILRVPDEIDVAKTTVQALQESEELGSLVYKTAQYSNVALEFLAAITIVIIVFVPILKLIGF